MDTHQTQSESTREITVEPKRPFVPFGPAMRSGPSHDEIARRAYEIYVKKGCRQGQCKQNWQQAERELRTPAVMERIESPSASRAEFAPLVKTFTGALSSMMGARGSRRGGTSPVLEEGRKTEV
ncbi:MAG: DUF2934 domain-containing protein [Phycisphaeraceae bacterium]|nr:DUF2934 domain-containing protein [Phycisphaeraceae bacterium]